MLQLGMFNERQSTKTLTHVHRLTWLKKRLNALGLHRKGPLVNYSSLLQVKNAIKVNCSPFLHIALFLFINFFNLQEELS